jgi:hypothetical protein
MRSPSPPKPVKQQELPEPEVVRAPFPAQDPEVLERAKRRKELALNRTGRRSTMLSENTRSMTGSTSGRTMLG